MDVTREVIRMVKEHKGSKKALFRKAGIAHSTYYDWANRDKSPTFGALECVALALGYRIKLERMDGADS